MITTKRKEIINKVEINTIMLLPLVVIVVIIVIEVKMTTKMMQWMAMMKCRESLQHLLYLFSTSHTKCCKKINTLWKNVKHKHRIMFCLVKCATKVAITQIYITYAHHMIIWLIVAVTVPPKNKILTAVQIKIKIKFREIVTVTMMMHFPKVYEKCTYMVMKQISYQQVRW